MMTRDNERGSTLVVVMLVVIVMLGMGLMAFRQTRTESQTTGQLRSGRQSYQAAYTGLMRAASLVLSGPPDYFHKKAVEPIAADATAPARYIFGQESGVAEDEYFSMIDPFDEAGTIPTETRDRQRIGFDPEDPDGPASNIEHRTEMTLPRLAATPRGFQVAGGQGNRFAFYTYQFKTTGWVNRTAGESKIAPGTGGAQTSLCADVRLGPVALSH